MTPLNYRSFLLVIMVSLGFHHAHALYDRNLFNKILAYSGPKTFIFSYPQSGNTLVRYCLEYLAHRPSFARWADHIMDLPIGWTIGFPLDTHKPPLEKVHVTYHLDRARWNIDTDYLIFIIRNPKEVLVRHASKESVLTAAYENQLTCPIRCYFADIEIYDRWPADKKILIYYENLVQAPEKELFKLLQFLDEPTDGLQEFMKNYANHKARALSFREQIGGCPSGDNVIYHSKELSNEDRLQIDAWIAKDYPDLWKKYLERYAESLV